MPSRPAWRRPSCRAWRSALESLNFPLSWLQWLVAGAVVAIGSLVQGSIGFGVALLAAPLLYLVDPVLVPAPMIVIGVIVSALVLWRDRAAVDPAEIGRVFPGLVVGVVAAALVLRFLPRDVLGLLFGVLVLLAVGLSIGRPAPTPGPRLLFWTGGVAGFMGTATSIGGPPLALAFQGRRGVQLRATLSACFVVLGLMSLAALHWAGHLDAGRALAGLSLLPAVALGVGCSAFTIRWLDRDWLRFAVLAVSALAGAAAIVRALL